MFSRLKSLSLALAAPLILWGCVLTPGKFVSTLNIAADRSFTFTYVGEVYAVDMGKDMMKGMGSSSDDTKPTDESSDGDEATVQKIALQDADARGDKNIDQADKDDDEDPKAKAAEADAKNQVIADALSKEAGYRKVTYAGGGKFLIDYAISGKLTHTFLFPYNSDAEVMFPFLTIELRGADRVRVKAPAFGASDTASKGAGMGMGMPDMSSAENKLDGTFTLTTDAEIVSQNNEAGATTVAGKKTIVWKANPATKDAPMAVLRVAGVVQ